MRELIPKQAKKPLFGQWFVLIVSVLLVGGVGLGFFVLSVLENNTKEILGALEEAVLKQRDPQTFSLGKELTEYKNKIDRFELVAAARKDFLSIFALLEQSTHTDVFFTDFKTDRISEIIMVEGIADSFFLLEEQRLLWEKQEQIHQVDIKSITLEEGGKIQFEAEFTL